MYLWAGMCMLVQVPKEEGAGSSRAEVTDIWELLNLSAGNWMQVL